ncbi:hypothetical protein M3J09_001704 [Ascochyta lentis]
MFHETHVTHCRVPRTSRKTPGWSNGDMFRTLPDAERRSPQICTTNGDVCQPAVAVRATHSAPRRTKSEWNIVWSPSPAGAVL